MVARKFKPTKYFQGLSKTRKAERHAEIQKYKSFHWKDPRAYKGFKTDRGVKGKQSDYTRRWKARFPNATSLKAKSEATGVPISYIRKSYNRGLAAWRTGHRPGATEQQWGYARVHSFLLCGKTYKTTDSDIAREAKRRSAKARKWWASC